MAKEKALEGVRVLDLGQIIAGNFASSLLADFGAEVIKIEKPGIGDGLRYMGRVVDGISLHFAVDARNKKNITLDLKSEEGKSVFLTMVKDADVVVENFAAGVLERMGLGYDVLAKVNPRIILGRVSGYGQTGPKSGSYGYDRIGLAYGGITYLSGEPDGAPMRPGVAIADYSSGLFCALGILIALYNRDIAGTGLGQCVELGLYESVFRYIETAVADYKLTGEIHERVGNDASTGAPANHYMTKDGQWVAIASTNDRVFARFAQAIGRPDLLEDSRYATQVKRAMVPENKEYIHQLTGEWIASHTERECAQAFADTVPYTKILSIADIFKEEQYAARNNIVEVPHHKFGTVSMQGIVPRMSRTPGEVKWAGRPLGSDNEEVFKQILGYSDADYNRLVEQGIV